MRAGRTRRREAFAIGTTLMCVSVEIEIRNQKSYKNEALERENTDHTSSANAFPRERSPPGRRGSGYNLCLLSFCTGILIQCTLRRQEKTSFSLAWASRPQAGREVHQLAFDLGQPIPAATTIAPIRISSPGRRREHVITGSSTGRARIPSPSRVPLRHHKTRARQTANRTRHVARQTWRRRPLPHRPHAIQLPEVAANSPRQRQILSPRGRRRQLRQSIGSEVLPESDRASRSGQPSPGGSPEARERKDSVGLLSPPSSQPLTQW
jgi:hypothetical protein